MNYHNIRKCDMLNGDGIRVVLFVSGCSHECPGCHNPETWNPESGILFDENAKQEVFKELDKYYVDGITLSGGDPLHPINLDDILSLIIDVRNKYPLKTIWLYTGYKWEKCFPDVVTNDLNIERVMRQNIIELCNYIVDGEYNESLRDANYPFAGSTNQRIINVKEQLISNAAIK